MTTTLSEKPMKPTLYATAKAAVSCAEFNAGEYVSVKFFHYGEGGEPWYLIDRSERGPLPHVVAYPAHHLTDFCL